MQLFFLFSGINFLMITITRYIFWSPAELILEKCNSSWKKPSDYNYISEFQEELSLQKLRLQVHVLGVTFPGPLLAGNCAEKTTHRVPI